LISFLVWAIFAVEAVGSGFDEGVPVVAGECLGVGEAFGGLC
jgi:hypothetical protein